MKMPRGWMVVSAAVVSLSIVGCDSRKTVGGTLTGLRTGTLVLQNSGTDDVTVTADGPFSFTNEIFKEMPFDVTVKTQPADQTCTVANGTGIVADEDVTVTVTCDCNPGFGGSNCAAQPWTLIAAGGHHSYNAHAASAQTCGIRGGRLFCMGSNALLNTDGTLSNSSKPVPVGTDADWTLVAPGGGFTCGIRAGQLYCWGTNMSQGKFGTRTAGLLGLGASFDTQEFVSVPTRVGTDADWSSVSAGTATACGIRAEGASKTAWCWGRAGNDGRIGDGTPNDANVPTLVAGGFTDWAQVKVSDRGPAFGIRDDGAGNRTLWFWGDSTSGLPASSNTPVQVGVDTTWSKITAGAWEFCGIQESGASKTLWCGGNNRHGQLGLGTFNSSNFTQVGSLTNWTDIEGGHGFFCGIESGDLYCWGRNHESELGLGDTDLTAVPACLAQHGSTDQYDCNLPQLVDGTRNWVNVAVGTSHTCATTDTGAMHCWGMNNYGQAGQESPSNVKAPTAVPN